MLYAFFAERRGSVSVMAGICFALLAAAAGLVVQASQFYVVKLREQRTADIATLAAANLRTPISDGVPTAAAIATAQNLAQLNGFAKPTVAVSALSNGTELKVTLTKNQPATFHGTGGSAKRSVISSAALSATPVTAPACVMSLLGETQLLSGGVITSPTCGSMASTYLQVNGGGLNVIAVALGYSKSQESPYLNSRVMLSPGAGDFRYSASIADPIAGDAGIASLTSKLTSMSAGWPFAKTSARPATAFSLRSGPNIDARNREEKVVAISAHVGNVTVKDARVTFGGSGGEDPQCLHPTTISGTIELSAASQIHLGAGCYVIKGDVVQADATYSQIHAQGSVHLVVQGRVLNTSGGSLALAPGSYDIAGGVFNAGGGQLWFGDGEKAISGTISNEGGSLFFSDGPVTLKAAAVINDSGTLNFQAGPYRIYNTTIRNSGVLNFRNGAFYLYSSYIKNMKGPGASLNLDGGDRYFGDAVLNFQSGSVTNIAAGNLDFYSSTVVLDRATLAIGSEATAASGAATIAMADSKWQHNSGTVTGQGVTFALLRTPIAFGEGALTLTAPTAVSPRLGTRNLLLYSMDLNVVFSNGARFNSLSGLIYAPRGNLSISGGAFRPPEQGCLSIVAARVRIDQSATAYASACSNFPFPTLKASPTRLRG